MNQIERDLVEGMEQFAHDLERDAPLEDGYRVRTVLSVDSPYELPMQAFEPVERVETISFPAHSYRVRVSGARVERASRWEAFKAAVFPLWLIRRYPIRWRIFYFFEAVDRDA